MILLVACHHHERVVQLAKLIHRLQDLQVRVVNTQQRLAPVPRLEVNRADLIAGEARLAGSQLRKVSEIVILLGLARRTAAN